MFIRERTDVGITFAVFPGETTMLVAATRVNLDNFIKDLMEGDLFVWGIVFAVVFFTGLQAYQKYRSFSSPKEEEF